MRTFAPLLLMPFVVGVILDDADAKGRPTDDRQPADTSRGVELVASLPKAGFERGEAIELSLEFKNNSGSPVTFVERGFWPNHHVLVKDRRGHEVEKKSEAWRDKRYGVSDRSVGIVIDPGSSFHGTRPINLFPLFKLPPGDYTVQVIYDEFGPRDRLKVASRAIGFTIVK